MAYTLKRIKKIIQQLKQEGGGIDDVVPALQNSEKLVSKLKEFWKNKDKPIVQLEPWMLRHLRFRQIDGKTQYQWKTDKKTIQLLKQAGIVKDEDDKD